MALAEELSRPGVSIEVAHRNVRSRVLKATGNGQTPWDSSLLTGKVDLGAGPGAAAFGGINDDKPFDKWSDQVLSRQETPGYVIEIE